MADSFTHFAALPVELRLYIWRLARQPRVVEVWYDADAECCRTTSHPPPLLHANRESRAEALRKGWYHRAFRTRAHAERYIYFSSSLDVLYVPRHGPMGYDDTARDFTVHVRDTADHVRVVAIDYVCSDMIRPWEPYNKLTMLLSFPHAREIILVVGGTTCVRAATNASHDRQPVRPRPHESIEGVPPAPSEQDVEVEFVDPQGDQTEIGLAVEDVLISFLFELSAIDAADSDTSSSSTKDGICDTVNPLRRLPVLVPKVPKTLEYHRCHGIRA